jgi:hypothetical protein
MLRFEWNALRVGDAVVVHDARGRDPARSGIVVMVDTKRGRRLANGVGISLGEGDGYRVVWPSFLAVHCDPVGSIDDCWRCAALAKVLLPPVGAPG